MIQQIEDFCSELQFEQLVNWKIAVYCKVPLGGAETAESISAKISLPQRVSIGIGWRRAERALTAGSTLVNRKVDRLSSRILWSVEIQRHTGYKVGSNIRHAVK